MSKSQTTRALTLTRTIEVPSLYRGTPDASLTLPTWDAEEAVMALSVDDRDVAVGEGFGVPAAGTHDWLTCDDSYVLATFGAFLAHAIESSDDDAREGWPVLTEDAADWVDALTLYSDADEYPACPICGDPIDYCLGHGERNSDDGELA